MGEGGRVPLFDGWYTSVIACRQDLSDVGTKKASPS